MPALWDTPWHGQPSERLGKSSHKRPVPNGLASKLWRITGMDLYYLTMGKIAKLKPQVDGLSKIEKCRYGWEPPNQPRNPA